MYHETAVLFRPLLWKIKLIWFRSWRLKTKIVQKSCFVFSLAFSQGHPNPRFLGKNESIFLATADIPSGYILVGVLGGMAFAPYYQTDETLLSKLNQISDKDWDTMTWTDIRHLRLLAYVSQEVSGWYNAFDDVSEWEVYSCQQWLESGFIIQSSFLSRVSHSGCFEHWILLFLWVNCWRCWQVIVTSEEQVMPMHHKSSKHCQAWLRSLVAPVFFIPRMGPCPLLSWLRHRFH